MRHATMCYDILPTNANPEHRSPFEERTGKRPTISHLRMFGAKAFHHRNVTDMREGQHKAQAGMYVGWSAIAQCHLILIPPSQGGPEELRYLQQQQIGALPNRQRLQLVESIHTRILDQEIPESVAQGKSPLFTPEYVPYDEEDDDSTITIIGNTAFDTPTEDRTVEGEVIDIDYHLTHCITAGHCDCINHSIEPADDLQVPHHKTLILKSVNDTADPLHSDPDNGHIPLVFAVGACKNWKEAKRSEHKHLYEIAKDAEWKQLTETYDVMDRIPIAQVPQGETLFPSSMLFSTKLSSTNEVIKGKARLCFGGHRMIEGIHFEPEGSSCPRWSSIRTFIANSARLGRRLKTADITGAYLRGPPQKPLYMRSPHDQIEYDENGQPYVWKVKGNLYGTKTASSCWEKYFSAFLLEIGFVRSKNEPCLYNRTRTLQDGTVEHTATLVYVDDLLSHSSTTQGLQDFEDELTSKFGDISPSDPSLYLGANLSQNKDAIHISSEAMIYRLAEQFFPHVNKSDIKTKYNTVPFPSKGSALGEAVLIQDCPDLTKGETPSKAPYRELVGALSYIAVTTRPDIAYYCSQLARVQSNPGDKHFKLAKHTLKYLMDTATYGCTYVKNHDEPELHYYVDSSWANIEPHYAECADGAKRTRVEDDGRRSAYGYVAYYAGGPVSWQARMFKGRRALSSTESELVAATEAAKDCLHMREIVKDITLKEREQPIIVYEDNQSMIKQCLRDGITQRSRHIEIRWFFVAQLQKEGVIQVTWKATGDMTADIFTKRLGVEPFSKCRDKLVQTPPN
jgi:hypothetical protein